jgi:hypothetical protein
MMKDLRLMGSALAAVVAVVAFNAATASATEAGLLYLAGESGQLTFAGSGKEGTLTSDAGTITCSSGEGTAKSTQTEKHVTTGTANVTLAGCKELKGTTKVACNTEGGAKEVVVLEGAFTMFNALNAAKTQLEPGIGATLPKTLTVKCGAVANIDFKGTLLGLVTQVSLTADITSGSLSFVNAGVTCDSEDSFCKKAQESANELLANFTGTFEQCEVVVLITGTSNKMVLIDD